jgi:multicomponent K+:H+ antiporter subunit F
MSLTLTGLLPFAVNFALTCFLLAMICTLLRLLRGPAAQDRILALDALYITGMLIILTLGIGFGAAIYFDIALLIALFGFVGSAAMAKFLLRGEVIEP